jgi:heat shock protein HslJ
VYGKKTEILSMKKLSLIAFSTMLIMSCNSRKNIQPSYYNPEIASSRQVAAVDFTGLYYALTPCADCEGIELQIELFADNTYKMLRTYAGKDALPINNTGSFKWGKTKNQIDLKDVNEGGAYEHFMLKDGKLILLDINGQIPVTNDINLYTLNKIDANRSRLSQLVNKYWKLVEIKGKPVEYKEWSKDAHITFKLNGEVFGNLSCNAYHAKYRPEAENRISISQGISTKKMCMDMSIEEELAKILEAVDSYNVSDNELILNRDNKAIAKFEAVWMH